MAEIKKEAPADVVEDKKDLPVVEEAVKEDE